MTRSSTRYGLSRFDVEITFRQRDPARDGRARMRSARCVYEQGHLGDLVGRNPDLFPKPVDQIVEKAWGCTSNFGRCLQEGRAPEFEEAELMVGISGMLCRYLARRTPGEQHRVPCFGRAPA